MPLFTGKVKISPQKEISSTPPPMEFNQATPSAYQMIALCPCDNMTLSLTEAPPPPPPKKLPGPTGATDRPVGHVLWNFHWFLPILGSYLEPMIKSWRWLVLKREIFIFALKASPTLSKLWFEWLPAMCWTWLKISGNPCGFQNSR